MGAFEMIVQDMAQMDVFQLFFPWLLVMSVSYGILEKYNIFSDEASVNGVIALSISFLAVGGALFFLPEGIMTSFAAGLTFSLFGLLGFLILMGVAGFDISGDKLADNPWSIPGIAALIFTLLSFLGAFVFQADVQGLLGGVQNAFQDVVMPILMLVFLIIIVALTTSD